MDKSMKAVRLLCNMEAKRVKLQAGFFLLEN